MVPQSDVCSLLRDRPLETLNDLVNELELSLVTVKDVIDRSIEDATSEQSYIGVNLGLYYQHAQSVILKCRALLQEPRKDGE
ncbi:MAG: hypothetical protein OEY86_07145 [Nitrospira sp.]|nr:hypothetical protein [Nitrospira sp.]